MALQLPKSLKQRIHTTIRTCSRTEKGYVGAAFMAVLFTGLGLWLAYMVLAI
jgi:hypothetical protein